MKTKKNRINGKSTGKYNGLKKAQAILSSNAPFAYVEAYKTLRTNLEFVTSANNIQTIVVTSAMAEESKSTTVINLAITLAEGNHSVIIVECDLRKPVMRRYLKLGRSGKGLSSILASNAAIEECITEIKDLDISVICAGTVPPNPSELLNRERMQDMLETLKDDYDYIILDAPPINVVTDAAILGRIADGAILVIRSKYAQAKAIRQAKHRLESVGVQLLGAVVTRFDIRKSGWRSGYAYKGYEYGYGQTGRKR